MKSLAALCIAAALVAAALCAAPCAPQPLPESTFTKLFGDLNQPWHGLPAVKSSSHAMPRMVRLSPASGTHPLPRIVAVAAGSQTPVTPIDPAASARITVLRI